jgi:hypothetical protein
MSPTNTLKKDRNNAINVLLATEAAIGKKLRNLQPRIDPKRTEITRLQASVDDTVDATGKNEIPFRCSVTQQLGHADLGNFFL